MSELPTIKPAAKLFEPVVPTSAKQIIEHIKSGGKCMVQVIPDKIATVHYPRQVQEIRMDGKGQYWFGVQMWAYQWFQFPSVGLTWTLI